jgi:endonuclease/exonuclease/phosphatase family metal-dependent hydrolase
MDEVFGTYFAVSTIVRKESGMKGMRQWLGMAVSVLMSVLISATCLAETPYVRSISKDGTPKDSLALVSWNACNFGKSKESETLAFMAELLRDADIVALQEVSTSGAGAAAVAKLADELGRKGAKWDYVVSDPTVGPGTEKFAFLFKAGRVSINHRDLYLASSLMETVDREPALMTFHAGNKQFRIASFHLRPTGKKGKAGPSGEVDAIGANPRELLDGPMILVGDFNLGHDALDPVFESVLHARHNIEGRTSLKVKLGKNGEYVYRGYDNVYTRGVTVYKSAILDFVPLAGDLETARIASDHLPVYIVFTP